MLNRFVTLLGAIVWISTPNSLAQSQRDYFAERTPALQLRIRTASIGSEKRIARIVSIEELLTGAITSSIDEGAIRCVNTMRPSFLRIKFTKQHTQTYELGGVRGEWNSEHRLVPGGAMVGRQKMALKRQPPAVRRLAKREKFLRERNLIDTIITVPYSFAEIDALEVISCDKILETKLDLSQKNVRDRTVNDSATGHSSRFKATVVSGTRQSSVGALDVAGSSQLIRVRMLGHGFSDVGDLAARANQLLEANFWQQAGYSLQRSNFEFVFGQNTFNLGCYYQGRRIFCDTTTISQQANLAPHDFIVVFLNTAEYGGVYDLTGTTRYVTVPIANEWSPWIFTHEFSHMFGDTPRRRVLFARYSAGALGDEYVDDAYFSSSPYLHGFNCSYTQTALQTTPGCQVSSAFKPEYHSLMQSFGTGSDSNLGPVNNGIVFQTANDLMSFEHPSEPATATPTEAPSIVSPSATPTQAPTLPPTATPKILIQPTPTSTATQIPTAIPTATATSTPVQVATATPTPYVVVSQATFFGFDNNQSGTWRPGRGAEGRWIAGGERYFPNYANVQMYLQSQWTYEATTLDTRGLFESKNSNTRLGTVWYSNNSEFYVDMDVGTSRAHTVSLYFVDWLRSGRSGGRVDVISKATGAVLDSRELSSYQNGQYLAYGIVGSVRFRISNTGGWVHTLAGVFLDN